MSGFLSGVFDTSGGSDVCTHEEFFTSQDSTIFVDFDHIQTTVVYKSLKQLKRKVSRVVFK
jgi:hypothetical protein